MYDLLTAGIVPVSVVRYIFDRSKLEISNIDYRTSSKEFKIKTIIDKSTGKSNVIVENERKQIPLGRVFFNTKEFYSNNIVNSGSKIKSLDIKHNKTDEVINMDIEFGDKDFKIPIEPGHTGVRYTDDSITVYESKTKKRTAIYTVIPEDGIREQTDVSINYLEVYNDKLIELEEFVNPEFRFALIPITKDQPSKITYDGESFYIEYDKYGLIKEIHDSRFPCYYYLYSNNIHSAIISNHKLMYDNFDMYNHFSMDNDLNQYETLIIKDEYVEITQFAYRGDLINEKELQTFDRIIDVYFNY